MNKPFAIACERNRAPIFSVIESVFADAKAILEIGSGTGQHAVFFAERLPHLTWHTSDLKINHADILAWIKDTDIRNVKKPLLLDVAKDKWPDISVDGVFSANTVHIMHWPVVKKMFKGIGKLLPDGGKFTLYGPVNFNGSYTSESNRNFDAWLKARDPDSGIRDFEAMDKLASKAGLKFQEDFEMPANNRILYWQKT